MRENAEAAQGKRQAPRHHQDRPAHRARSRRPRDGGVDGQEEDRRQRQRRRSRARRLPAILLAHHPISQEDQMMLATAATWLDRVRRARNLSSTSVGGLWAAILSGQGSSRKWTVPITSPEHRTAGIWLVQDLPTAQWWCRPAATARAHRRGDECRRRRGDAAPPGEPRAAAPQHRYGGRDPAPQPALAAAAHGGRIKNAAERRYVARRRVIVLLAISVA